MRPINSFKRCPRCAERGFEHLHTYSHCVNCFYVDDPTLERMDGRLEILMEEVGIKKTKRML